MNDDHYKLWQMRAPNSSAPPLPRRMNLEVGGYAIVRLLICRPVLNELLKFHDVSSCCRCYVANYVKNGLIFTKRPPAISAVIRGSNYR